MDNHPVVRRGLRKIISNEDGLEVVDEASGIDELMKKLEKANCQMIFLDITLSSGNGFIAIPRILKHFPDVKIIMFSGMPEIIYASKCIKAGAKGYLHKNASAEEILKALRKVISGGIYSSPQHLESLAVNYLGSLKQSKVDCLSNKEFQVMILLAAGKQVSEIALDMNMSPRTIRSYKTRIISKMQMNCMADLMKYCVEKQLI